MFKTLATAALLFTSMAAVPTVEARTQSHQAFCNVTFVDQYGLTKNVQGYGSMVFNYGSTDTLTVTAPRFGTITFRDTNSPNTYVDQNGRRWTLVPTGTAGLVGSYGDYRFMCQATS